MLPALAGTPIKKTTTTAAKTNPIRESGLIVRPPKVTVVLCVKPNPSRTAAFLVPFYNLLRISGAPTQRRKNVAHIVNSPRSDGLSPVYNVVGAVKRNSKFFEPRAESMAVWRLCQTVHP